jgi:glutaredoxin
MKIVSGPYCGRCKVAKQILTEKGYVVNEIMANSDEGKEIIDKTQAKELPILINEGKILKGQEVLDFASKAKGLK